MDGTLQYTYVVEKKGSTMWLNQLDLSQPMVGEAKQLPNDFMIQGHSCVADGESMADVVYATMNGVYSVNMGDTESNNEFCKFRCTDYKYESYRNFG